jgi:hypothetical protein
VAQRKENRENGVRDAERTRKLEILEDIARNSSNQSARIQAIRVLKG